MGAGLINDTFAVDASDGLRYVLQRVHPVFDPVIHDNIALVTDTLAQGGLTTPRLVLAAQGERFVMHDAAPWRLMTRVAGVTHDRVLSAARAFEAAALLGRFHAAVAHLQPASFSGLRVGVHDTPAHLQKLRRALHNHRQHRLYDGVAPLAEALLRTADTLPALPDTPARVGHGDPKFNNVVFAADDSEASPRAVAWIDLDTVGPTPLAYELGDAWRSWCNPSGEDASEAAFDETIYAASLRGWLGTVTPQPTAAECDGLLGGVEWITLELAARFFADALAEHYFGWDASRFAGRGEHNLVRGLSQWTLHQRVVEARPRREQLLREALDRR